MCASRTRASSFRVHRALLRELKQMVRRGSVPHRVAQRARVVLLARPGLRTEEIARRLGWPSRAMRKWKARFAERTSLGTLDDRPRSAVIPLTLQPIA
jgi:uncharacterized membrane protein